MSVVKKGSIAIGALLLLFCITVPASAGHTTAVLEGGTGYVLEIKGLHAPGGVYDILFVEGSFNTVYGAGVPAGPVGPFPLDADVNTAGEAIRAFLASLPPSPLGPSLGPSEVSGLAYNVQFLLPNFVAGTGFSPADGAHGYSARGGTDDGLPWTTVVTAPGFLVPRGQLFNGLGVVWAVASPAVQGNVIPAPGALVLALAGMASLSGYRSRRRMK